MKQPAKKTIPYHEVASIFPLMEGAEFQALIDDIRRNGLKEPIWTYQGKIIDGRNRYSAILRLQEQGHPVQHKFREWDGKGKLSAFVISLNLHRRHLTESQRAMIAGSLSGLAKGKGKSNAPIGALSQPEAANLLNVSRRAVQRASKVTQHGDEDLINAVQSGEMTVSAAAQTVDAAEKYPEVAAVVARPKDLATIAKNLDSLPDSKRKEKIKKFVKGDLTTIRELADKKPVPPSQKSKAREWAEWVQDARIRLSKVRNDSYKEGVLINWTEGDKNMVLEAIDLFMDDLEAFREDVIGGLTDDRRPEESFEGAVN